MEQQPNGGKIVVPVALTEEQFEFEGALVTVVKVDRSNGCIAPMIPLAEIAERIGYESRHLWMTYKRNEVVLSGYSCILITRTHDNDGREVSREQLCFTRDGLVGLLMKLNLKRIKDPEKRDRITRFQKWGIETLGKLIAGEDALMPKQQLITVLSNIEGRLAKLESANPWHPRGQDLDLYIYDSIRAGKNPALISRELGISPPSLQYYIDKLKQLGTIKKAGYGTWAVVTSTRHKKAAVKAKKREYKAHVSITVTRKTFEEFTKYREATGFLTNTSQAIEYAMTVAMREDQKCHPPLPAPAVGKGKVVDPRRAT